jgi:hypothetical protein
MSVTKRNQKFKRGKKVSLKRTKAKGRMTVENKQIKKVNGAA